MSWIVSNWRLKLLALVLSVALLGAVAFSENPLTLSTEQVRINYAGSGLAPNVVLVNPPASVGVPVFGVRDAISSLGPASIVVTPDLSHLRVGSTTVSVTPKILVQGVTAQSNSVQISLTAARLVSQTFAIDVRIPNLTSGVTIDAAHTFVVCGDTLTPCQVRVTAPASFMNGLDAYVEYSGAIGTQATVDSNNYPVHFEQSGRPIDFSALDDYPLPAVDHANVGVHIQTLGGTQSLSVPLRVTTTGTPACGYQLASVSIQPSALVQVSGPTGSVSNLSVIQLAPVDLSGLSSGTTVTRPVSTGSPTLKADPSSVRVLLTLTQAFSCAAPSPSPATAPTPPG
ncbi:MAG TPA: CdaR family protein [Candidatus Nitrosotalea sp.]|nr:CdaR family protein [Candidatus Nitrosotalea sp.]